MPSLVTVLKKDIKKNVLKHCWHISHQFLNGTKMLLSLSIMDICSFFLNLYFICIDDQVVIKSGRSENGAYCPYLYLIDGSVSVLGRIVTISISVTNGIAQWIPGREIRSSNAP